MKKEKTNKTKTKTTTKPKASIKKAEKVKTTIKHKASIKKAEKVKTTSSFSRENGVVTVRLFTCPTHCADITIETCRAKRGLAKDLSDNVRLRKYNSSSNNDELSLCIGCSYAKKVENCEVDFIIKKFNEDGSVYVEKDNTCTDSAIAICSTVAV